MTTAVQTPVQSEYRNLPLESLTESPLNPRRTFDERALQELADFVPGHKIGVLFRRPSCCRRRGEPYGDRRLPLMMGT